MFFWVLLKNENIDICEHIEYTLLLQNKRRRNKWYQSPCFRCYIQIYNPLNKMILNLKEGEYLGQNLKAANYDFFKINVSIYEPNFETLKHYHDNDYLSILIKGRYDEKNTTENKLISCGDILFRPSKYTHQDSFENQRGACFNIEFKPDWEKKLDTNLRLPNKLSYYKTGSFPSLYKSLLNFQADYNEELSFEYICDWLFQLNQINLAKGSLPWINKIAQILENELDCFHSIQSLSERVYVHPIYLVRAFKERKGLTVGEYQLKMKIENSVSLLLNTSLSISDISFRNGFYDDAHFIRTFKSVYNISPHQFRLSLKRFI